MLDDETLLELYRIKDELAEEFPTVHALAEEARRVAREEPLPPAGKHRKMIPGFPKGQSVGDVDPIMQEVYNAKEALAKQFDYDIHRMAEHFRRDVSKSKNPPRPTKKVKARPKSTNFRTEKSKTVIKHRRSSDGE